MYIQNGLIQYPCADYRPIPGISAAFTGVEGLALPVSGSITLRADDGFEMAQEDAGAYARQVYESGVLTLTNEPEPPSPTIEEIRASKLAELSEASEAAIVAGVDVTTAYGSEHFSLNDHDQTNITNLSILVRSGAPGYLYHADDKACVMYTAADIDAIVTAALQHITYHTTYHNFIKQWVNREEDAETVQGIAYGDELPADLATTMDALLIAVGGGG